MRLRIKMGRKASRLGVAYVEGLQDDGEVLKSAACAKHFAVHSGPEAVRHEFDAVADILFGDCSPSGKLPVTVYHSVEEMPAFEDYSMKGRTYRYMQGEPLYPFGYGLTYGDVRVESAAVSARDTICGDVTLRVKTKKMTSLENAFSYGILYI